MRLATRSRMIATVLAIGAILAPNAQAGLFSTGADPKGAGQQEAQGFLRIYSRPDKSIIRVTTPGIAPQAVVRITTPPNGFDWGDAGIGAGVMAGLTLLGAAGAVTVRRRHALRHT